MIYSLLWILFPLKTLVGGEGGGGGGGAPPHSFTLQNRVHITVFRKTNMR